MTGIRHNIRNFLERRSRRVILRRRLPDQFGGDPIFVSPEAMLKFWWPGVERADTALFAWAAEFVGEGATVWDVGANVGLFAFASASLAGPSGYVLAVEPDTWLADLLRRSARSGTSARAPVEVLPAAVLESVHIARLSIAERSRASNFVQGAASSSQVGGVRETQRVVAVTLDWLLDHFPAPDIVKIDVEGAEAQVLGGASRLLEEIRPVVLCEVAEQNAEVVGSLLRSYAYSLFDLSHGGERRPQSLPPFNSLARPDSIHKPAAREAGREPTANSQDIR